MIVELSADQLLRLKLIKRGLDSGHRKSGICLGSEVMFDVPTSTCINICGKMFPSLVVEDCWVLGEQIMKNCPCYSGLSINYLKRRVNQVIKENEREVKRGNSQTGN